MEYYVTEFRRWNADTCWNNTTLRYYFCLGLAEPLKDELARVGVPSSLEGRIILSTQIDHCLRERRWESSCGQSCPIWMLPKSLPPANIASAIPASSTAEEPELMQLRLLCTSLELLAEQPLPPLRRSGALYVELPILPVNLPPVPFSSTHVALSISSISVPEEPLQSPLYSIQAPAAALLI